MTQSLEPFPIFQHKSSRKKFTNVHHGKSDYAKNATEAVKEK